MKRVKHKVLALWPEFNNGPVGRMDFFVSYLGIMGIMLVGAVVAAVLQDATGGDLGAALGGLAYLGLFIWIFAHSIALVYKRIWDVGFEDAGARAGMTIGYFLVSFIPFITFIAGLALMFWPQKKEVIEA